MNRNEEYNSLLDELDETPLKLDFTLDRALLKRREHKRQVHRAIFAPLGTLAAVFVVFVLLVNISPTFAYAAGRVPLLRDLAKFVVMSPSLSAAVENEYVQPVGLEQTKDGVTARIEYVIVDQKQLNVFYTLDSDVYIAMAAAPGISGIDTEILEGFSIVSGYWGDVNGELRKATVDFSSGTMPDNLIFKLRVWDNGTPTAHEPVQSIEENLLLEDDYEEPKTISEFSFTLLLDPNFTETGDQIELNKAFVLDGQKLTLTSAEIYPTHMRFTFEDDKSNTAWMKELKFYLENEEGERFEGVSNGVSAYGKLDSPMMATYMLESAFFSKSEHLTLHITGVTWLDKDMEKIHVDLSKKTADILPDEVRFDVSKKMENGWFLEFSAPEIEKNYSYQIIGWDYYDAEGNTYAINSMSSGVGGYISEDMKDRFTEQISLKDYPYDEVWLCPSYSRHVTLDTPISIEIK